MLCVCVAVMMFDVSCTLFVVSWCVMWFVLVVCCCCLLLCVGRVAIVAYCDVLLVVCLLLLFVVVWVLFVVCALLLVVVGGCGCSVLFVVVRWRRVLLVARSCLCSLLVVCCLCLVLFDVGCCLFCLFFCFQLFVDIMTPNHHHHHLRQSFVRGRILLKF